MARYRFLVLSFILLAAVAVWIPGGAEPAEGVAPTNIVILGGPAAVSDAVATQLATCTSGTVSRLSGSNRYSTAASISKAYYPAGADVAYVATGVNFPDALAGGAAAGLEGGPVLLVEQNLVPAATAIELARLAPKRIVILGGTAAVSAAVETALGLVATTERIAGTNRYATAALVSTRSFAPGVGAVYVATGENFPDALSGGPAAIDAKGPVLLVQQNAVPVSVQNELTRLNPNDIAVLGGPAAVSDAVATQLGTFANSVTRLSGTNRYATAAAVSQDTFAAGANTILVATGENFPDALAGGAVAGIANGPILLVQQNAIPSATLAEIQRLTGETCSTPPPTTTTTTTTSAVPPNPGDTKNCSDFSTQAEAQAWFDLYYPYYGDVAGLDADDDRVACESLP